jgi:hypothetical protein
MDVRDRATWSHFPGARSAGFFCSQLMSELQTSLTFGTARRTPAAVPSARQCGERQCGRHVWWSIGMQGCVCARLEWKAATDFWRYDTGAFPDGVGEDFRLVVKRLRHDSAQYLALLVINRRFHGIVDHHSRRLGAPRRRTESDGRYLLQIPRPSLLARLASVSLAAASLTRASKGASKGAHTHARTHAHASTRTCLASHTCLA